MTRKVFFYQETFQFRGTPNRCKTQWISETPSHLELPDVFSRADHGDEVEAVVVYGDPGDRLAQRAVIVPSRADHVSEVETYNYNM